jgi:magnesium chelatase subunit I
MVEEVANVARESEWVDQSSGVSARLTIALLEALVSNAERRAIRKAQDDTSVRLSDFFRANTAITGKVELVFEGEREGPQKVACHLVGKAAERLFNRRFPDFFSQDNGEASPYDALANHFKNGGEAVCDDLLTDDEVEAGLTSLPGMTDLLKTYLAELEPECAVFGCELILEGLHQHSVLAREPLTRGSRYSDMVSRMWDDFDGTAEKRP